MVQQVFPYQKSCLTIRPLRVRTTFVCWVIADPFIICTTCIFQICVLLIVQFCCGPVIDVHEGNYSKGVWAVWRWVFGTVGKWNFLNNQ